MIENTPDVLDEWLDSRLKNVHTCLPGQIESYNPATRKATVRILIRPRTLDNETALSIPPISNVPVIFPSGANFSLKWNPVNGDGCLILFSEEGIGDYLNGTTEMDADDLSKFNLTDAICLPGLFPFSKIPSSKGTIEIDNNGNININNGTKGVARKDDIIEINATTDPAFFTYLGTLTPPFAGTSITGKINAGSDKVKAG